MGGDEGVFDLAVDPLEVLCIDTSAVAALLIEDWDGHAELGVFLPGAIDERRTFVYSELLELELAQACAKAARKRHHGRPRQSIRAGRELIHQVFERWNLLIAETWSERVSLSGSDHPDLIGSPVRVAAFHLIEEHGLESYDATDAATAIVFGAPILTCDKGFGDVPKHLLDVIAHQRVVPALRARRRQAANRVGG